MWSGFGGVAYSWRIYSLAARSKSLAAPPAILPQGFIKGNYHQFDILPAARRAPWLTFTDTEEAARWNLKALIASCSSETSFFAGDRREYAAAPSRGPPSRKPWKRGFASSKAPRRPLHESGQAVQHSGRRHAGKRTRHNVYHFQDYRYTFWHAGGVWMKGFECVLLWCGSLLWPAWGTTRWYTDDASMRNKLCAFENKSVQVVTGTQDSVTMFAAPNVAFVVWQFKRVLY